MNGKNAESEACSKLAGSIAIVAALFCSGVQVQAQAQTADSTIARIKASNKVKIGVRDFSVPFSYLDANQKPTGYSVELCEAVVESLKKELNLPSLEVVMQSVDLYAHSLDPERHHRYGMWIHRQYADPPETGGFLLRHGGGLGSVAGQGVFPDQRTGRSGRQGRGAAQRIHQPGDADEHQHQKASQHAAHVCA